MTMMATVMMMMMMMMMMMIDDDHDHDDDDHDHDHDVDDEQHVNKILERLQIFRRYIYIYMCIIFRYIYIYHYISYCIICLYNHDFGSCLIILIVYPCSQTKGSSHPLVERQPLLK